MEKRCKMCSLGEGGGADEHKYKEDKKVFFFLQNSTNCAHLAKEEEQKMRRREKKPHCPLGLDHLVAGAEGQSGRTPRPLDFKFKQQQNIKIFFSTCGTLGGRL